MTEVDLAEVDLAEEVVSMSRENKRLRELHDKYGTLASRFQAGGNLVSVSGIHVGADTIEFALNWYNGEYQRLTKRNHELEREVDNMRNSAPTREDATRRVTYPKHHPSYLAPDRDFGAHVDGSDRQRAKRLLATAIRMAVEGRPSDSIAGAISNAVDSLVTAVLDVTDDRIRTGIWKLL